MYGVPSASAVDPSLLSTRFRKAGITAVFVPPHKDTVREYKDRGFRVYVSLNVFGGKAAWRTFPESRPVLRDGKRLTASGKGGVCPTHPGWRQGRLDRLRRWITDLGGEAGIDGVWLDFLRYPGEWERAGPRIPDTCYCRRCITLFQEDTGRVLPAGAVEGKPAADWIRSNAPYAWMNWKKAQIDSFARAARAIVGDLQLGVFVVPWKKGDHGNAISYALAQDVERLSEVADAVSPMAYHGMCGKPLSWVGLTTRYFRETARCGVWPIVQSAGVSREAFKASMRSVADGMADAVLVYKLSGVREPLWEAFEGVKRPPNRLPVPAFDRGHGEKGAPNGWRTGNPDPDNPHRSRFHVRPAGAFSPREGRGRPPQGTLCLGVTAGNDGEGFWEAPLPPGRAGERYLFTADLYRTRWENGEYAGVRIWGTEHELNTHLQTRVFQPVRIRVTGPEGQGEAGFRFVNRQPGETYWLCRPALRRSKDSGAARRMRETGRAFLSDFFPIGAFGADQSNLARIKALALNTVVIHGQGEALMETVRACREQGLRFVISVPRDPDRLVPFLDRIRRIGRFRDAAFYVNDEPGIHAFPRGRAEDIRRLIEARFPDATTCMAVVRPQVCVDYEAAADFFMMDQYPVPFQPMTWLSDSMDRAAEDVGRERLASVIQAFGGAGYKNAGWPRLPTWREMDCLAFLSIIHGSRGIFFYTFREMGATEEGRERLGRVTGRLNRAYPWLLEKNEEPPVPVVMTSERRVDPMGRPAVHACVKRRGNELLVLAVNTIHTPVEAVLTVPQMAGSGRAQGEDLFTGEVVMAGDGALRSGFGPYEARGFLFRMSRGAPRR